MFDARAKKAKKRSKGAFIILMFILAVGIFGIILACKFQLDYDVEPELAIFRSVFLGGIYTIMAALAPFIIFMVNKGKSGRAARRNVRLSNTDVTDTKLKDKAELEDNISYYSNKLQKVFGQRKMYLLSRKRFRKILILPEKTLQKFIL